MTLGSRAGTTFIMNISKALLSWPIVYFQVHDIKWVCWRRCSGGIQSTSAHPNFPSLGQKMSIPIGVGSSRSQNGSFMSMNVGFSRPVRVRARSANSLDKRYLRLTPACGLWRARIRCTCCKTSSSDMPSCPRRRLYSCTVSPCPCQSSCSNISSKSFTFMSAALSAMLSQSLLWNTVPIHCCMACFMWRFT